MFKIIENIFKNKELLTLFGLVLNNSNYEIRLGTKIKLEI